MNEPTMIKMLVHLAEREQKLRKAAERLLQWHQSRKTHGQLLHRLDALESRIAPKPTGRPGKWRGEIGNRTIVAVEAMRRRGFSIADALRWLRKKQPWASWWEGHSEAGLQSRYQDALTYWEPLFHELQEIELTAAGLYPDEPQS